MIWLVRLPFESVLQWMAFDFRIQYMVLGGNQAAAMCSTCHLEHLTSYFSASNFLRCHPDSAGRILIADFQQFVIHKQPLLQMVAPKSLPSLLPSQIFRGRICVSFVHNGQLHHRRWLVKFIAICKPFIAIFQSAATVTPLSPEQRIFTTA